MHNNSWSLVFFTLLSQFAAGLMIFFTTMFFLSPPAFQMVETRFCLKSPDFLAMMMMAFAIIFSFLHLGKKSNAVNAMNHLSSSWLSREIFALLLFGSSVLLAFLLRIYNPQIEWIIPVSLVFSSLAGIFLVSMISNVYLIKTIPPWNSWYTPTSFFSSAISLGAAGIVFISLIHLSNQETNSHITKFVGQIIWVLAIALAIEIISTIIFQSKLAKESPVGIERISFTSGTYQTLKVLRVFILLITLVFTLYFIFRLPGITDSQQVHLRFFIMIFAIIVIQEIIGRHMFYASYYRVGV